MKRVIPILLCGLLFSCQQCPHKKNDFDPIITVLERIERDYADPLTREELIKKVLEKLFSALDPYSSYLSPQHYRSLMQMTKGQVSGTGLELIEHEGKIIVVAPLAGSPSEKIGIKSGDIITHVDYMPIEANASVESVIQRLRGLPGTKVAITAERRNFAPLNFILTREIVRVYPVKYTIYNDIVYIKVVYFADKTKNRIKKILKLFPKMKGLILDLRNNPGGQFDEAIETAGLFLEPSIIVKVQSRLERYHKIYCSEEHDYIKGVPMVVLVNGGSASASEVVAGALKHYNRAVLIGTKTLGKGAIQEIYPLQKYGGFKLTVAHFLAPSGQMIHKHGIHPDIYVEDPEVMISKVYWEKMLRVDQQFRKAVQYLQNSQY